MKIADFIKSKAEKNTRKMPYFVTVGQKGAILRTGLTKAQKTTEIIFDETGNPVFIRTHNTDLKKRLTAYTEQYPDYCKQTEDDEEIGCKAFEIQKGRFSIRLTAPYSEERRQAASEWAKKKGIGAL